ncbi:MAG: alpha/beta fold hydrolase [Gammaproteobacteria bacterium]|nr:alpha/beta fold hydrolase [Gammaproteobacteria bacterium]
MSTTHTWTVIDKRRNRKLAVAITGKRGLPFVWGHALQCSMQADEASTIFDWPGLATTVQLIRYDARAHGESCAEHDPQACRWESLARDMWRVAEDCGANTAVLGGASMGCATALHAAMLHPERVLGLVLVIPPTAWELRPRQARAYRIMARVVRFTGRLPFRLAASMLGKATPGTPLRAMARAVVRELATRDPRNVEAAFNGAALSDLPSPARLAQLGMPTLILAWQNDTAHPIGVAQRLASLLPDATLVVAENDAAIRRWPEEVARFLDSIRRQRSKARARVRRRQVAGNVHASPIASLSRP